MKTRFTLLTIFSALLMSASCDKQEAETGYGTRKPVAFTTTIEGHSLARAAGTQWGNDDIGIYMIKSGETLSSTSELAGNKKYHTNSTGNFTATTGNEILIPTDDSKVDFIAYYPYTGTVDNHTYKVDVSNQSSQEAIDLLWSDNAKNKGKDDSSISLTFTRPLVKLVFHVKPETAGTSLDGLAATISGTKTLADFSLATGQLTVESGSAAIIDMKVSAETGGKLVEAILLPAAAPTGASVRFALAGKTYTWNIPAGTSLDAGQKYIYNIVLKGNGSSIVEPDYPWLENPAARTDIPNTDFVYHMLSRNTNNGTPMRNYSMLYDTHYKLAYWVAYPLHSSYLGSAGRNEAWQYDPKIAQSAQPRLKSGFENGTVNNRGHQLPSSDRQYSKVENQTTFYYSNMTAQNGTMNQGIWRLLEEQVRTWTAQCDTMYVVTGAMITTATDKNITYVKDNDGVNIAKPKYYFKALAQLRGGAYYTIAFRLPNEPISGNYNTYRKTVKELEEETGFTFFPSIPESAKTNINTNYWN